MTGRLWRGAFSQATAAPTPSLHVFPSLSPLPSFLFLSFLLYALSLFADTWFTRKGRIRYEVHCRDGLAEAETYLSFSLYVIIGLSSLSILSFLFFSSLFETVRVVCKGGTRCRRHYPQRLRRSIDLSYPISPPCLFVCSRSLYVSLWFVHEGRIR